MAPADAISEGPDRTNALEQLNAILAKEGFDSLRRLASVVRRWQVGDLLTEVASL